jgi:hypothetical protein
VGVAPPTGSGTGPPPTPHAGGGHLEPEEFERWYGGLDPLDPTTIGAFMDGFDRPWWVIGGWSIQAFTGVPRPHEDLDVSILACDAEAFRVFLGDRWTAWNVDEDTDGRWTNKRDPSHTEELDDVTWVAPDGLRYARPEVSLMFKAAQARAKDRRDAEVTIPMLDAAARRWLSAAVARLDARHPWLETL